MFGGKPDKRCIRLAHYELQNLAERVKERSTCLQMTGCTPGKTQISPKWINSSTESQWKISCQQ